MAPSAAPPPGSATGIFLGRIDSNSDPNETEDESVKY